MKRVEVKLSEPTEDKLEAFVDEDIRDFEVWFLTTVDKVPLTPSEFAIIKTYLYYKLKIAAKKEGLDAPLPYLR